MIGTKVCEVIPFCSFKEKLRLIKIYRHKGKIEVYKNYILVSLN